MVVGRGNVIDNVYIVYLSCDIAVLLYNCCIKKEKTRKLQGSVAHVPTLVYPLHQGNIQVAVV